MTKVCTRMPQLVSTFLAGEKGRYVYEDMRSTNKFCLETDGKTVVLSSTKQDLPELCIAKKVDPKKIVVLIERSIYYPDEVPLGSYSRSMPSHNLFVETLVNQAGYTQIILMEYRKRRKML